MSNHFLIISNHTIYRAIALPISKILLRRKREGSFATLRSDLAPRVSLGSVGFGLRDTSGAFGPPLDQAKNVFQLVRSGRFISFVWKLRSSLISIAWRIMLWLFKGMYFYILNERRLLPHLSQVVESVNMQFSGSLLRQPVDNNALLKERSQ